MVLGMETSSPQARVFLLTFAGYTALHMARRALSVIKVRRTIAAVAEHVRKERRTIRER